MAIVLTGASFGRRLVREAPNTGFGQNLLESTLWAVDAPVAGAAQELPQTRRAAHYAAAIAAAGINLLAGTLGLAPGDVAGAAVFTDRAPAYFAAPDTPPNLLLTTLAEAPAPVAVFAPENPRASAHPVALRTWTHSTPLNLLGQDRFFAAAGQAPVYDWPNPLRQAASRQADSAPNLLAGTLGVPPEPPFAQYDWPNPRGHDDLGAPLHLARTDTGTAPATPVAALEWSNPLARRAAVQGWSQNLLGSTLFFEPEKPVGAAALDVPRRLRATVVAAATQNLTATTLAAPAPQPFASFDWPVPRKARQYSTPRSFRPDLQAEGIPPGSAEAGFPRAPRRSIELRSWSQNLLGSTLFTAPPQPFTQSQWPNPRGYRYAIALRGFVEPLKLNLLGQDKFFGAAGQPPANLDWPVPKGRRAPIELRSWAIELQQSTLAPGAAAPFVPVQWANPPRRAIVRQAPLAGVSGTILGELHKPFAQTDWALPIRRIPARQQQQQGSPAAEPASPFAQHAWLNPLRIARQQHETAPNLQVTAFYIAPPAPFAQTEWPVPRGYHYSVGLRTHTQNLQVQYTPPPIFGWGARTRLGGTPARDPWQRIGESPAQADEAQLGSSTAGANPGKIGSSEA